MQNLIMFAHYVDDLNHIIGWKIVVVGFLACWLLAASITTKNIRARTSHLFLAYPKKYYAALAIGAGLVALEFVVADFVQWAAWQEIKPRLFSQVYGVTVNGVRATNPASLITSLRETHDIIGHHSHPTRGYSLALRTSFGPLILDMKRDSGIPNEYWVYDPSFHSAYLGRAETDALSKVD
jgi:hypothetical protein